MFMFLKTCFLLLVVTSAFAQDSEIETTSIKFSELKDSSKLTDIGMDESQVNEAIELSRSHLKDVVKEKDLKELKPQKIEIDVPKNKDSKKTGGMIYITWGYNRSWFSKTDTTFHTPDGTFTIHGAQGKDRPTTELKTYMDPTKFTVPQYNFRIGYKFNSNFSVELGTDHMKWIFVPEGKYEITGNYDKPLWTRDHLANGEMGNDHQTTFADAQAAQNADFVHFEHSDGYNYPHLSALYTQKIFETRNKRLFGEVIGGAGAGVLVPKTRVMIRDGEYGNWRDVDNKFHVAGWGAHVDANLRIGYRLKNGNQFFLQASNRGHVGKINNALFLGSDSGRITQSPIYTYEVYVSAGYTINLDKKRKDKKK